MIITEAQNRDRFAVSELRDRSDRGLVTNGHTWEKQKV